MIVGGILIAALIVVPFIFGLAIKIFLGAALIIGGIFLVKLAISKIKGTE